jgi:hypothetical protein
MSAPPGSSIDLGASRHGRSFLFHTSSRKHSMAAGMSFQTHAEASNKGREHGGFAAGDTLSPWTPQERFVKQATKRQGQEAGASWQATATALQTFTADSLACSNAEAVCHQLLSYAESTGMCMYGVWVAPHPRMYSELPRNACVHRDWTVLKRTLCEMSFIVQAIACEGLASLLDTIDFALSCVQAVLLASPSPFAAESTYTPARMSAYLTQLATFLREHRNTFSAWPDQVIQMACSAASQGHVMQVAHTCLERAEDLIQQCEAQCEHVGAPSMMMQGDASMHTTSSFWQLLTALDKCGYTTCLDEELQDKASSMRARLGAVILDSFVHDTWQLWKLRVMRDASEHHQHREVRGADMRDEAYSHYSESSRSSLRFLTWRCISVFISCPLQQQSQALRAHLSDHVIPHLQAACVHMGVEIELFDLEQTQQEHAASPESGNVDGDGNQQATSGPAVEETSATASSAVVVLIECAEDGQARALWDGNMLCLWVPQTLLRTGSEEERESGQVDEPVENVQEAVDQVCGLLCVELCGYTAKLANAPLTVAPTDRGD